MLRQLRNLVLRPVRTGLGLARLPFRVGRGLLGRRGRAITFRPSRPAAPRRRTGAVPLVDDTAPTAPRARAKATLREERTEPVSAKRAAGPTPGQAARLREEQREHEGAPDGPGPAIHVDPPWEGYDGMTAAEIIARLESADAAEAAVVALYEGAHRARSTVLKAAGARR